MTFEQMYPGVVPNGLQFPHTFAPPDQTSLHSVGTHGNAISTLGSASAIQYYIAPPIPSNMSASVGQATLTASQTGTTNWPGS